MRVSKPLGFILTEMLFALILGGIILAGLAVVLRMTLISSIKMADSADLNLQIMRLEKRFESDVKYTTKINTQTVSYLSIDIDSPFYGEQLVEYSFDESTGILNRSDNTNTLVVARYIDQFEFRYLTTTGNESTKPLDTQLVVLDSVFRKKSVPSESRGSKLKLTFQFRNLRSGS